MIKDLIELKKIIESDDNIKVDGVYTHYIPEEFIDKKDRTDVLLRESTSSIEDRGNDAIIRTLSRVNIQVFFSRNYKYSIDEFNSRLVRLLEKNDWVVDVIEGLYVEPETKQLTKAFVVSKSDIMEVY